MGINDNNFCEFCAILEPKAIDHKLHIAGARCFGASGRNLFAQVRGGDNLFSQGHSVIFKEDQFELVTDDRIVVNDFGDAADELDDLLGQMISWSSLATYHDSSWDKSGSWVLLYSIVQSDNVQTV